MNERDRALARYLNGLSEAGAREALLLCCGSERWVRAMLSRRPFADDEGVLGAAAEEWWALDEEDWLEAFAAHPRIGETRPGEGAAADRVEADGAEAEDAETDGEGFARAWSRREQSGMAVASPGTRRAMAEGNREYERRFGHVFLIRAAGRSGEEMLAELRRRLGNDPETELREAAREQLEITRLRLRELVEEP